jgi:hypothetical protein
MTTVLTRFNLFMWLLRFCANHVMLVGIVADGILNQGKPLFYRAWNVRKPPVIDSTLKQPLMDSIMRVSAESNFFIFNSSSSPYGFVHHSIST